MSSWCCRSAELGERNVSGLCAVCYQRLPAVAKASRSTRVDVIVARYAARMAEVYGPSDAARLMYGDAEVCDIGPIDWASWREALRHVVHGDSVQARSRRRERAERRAGLIRYLPPPDAPLDPTRVGNAFGKTKPGARMRAEVLMRVAVALWGLGVGPTGILAVAGHVGIAISSSAIGRLLRQARADFEGAVVVRVGDLAAALDTRDGRIGG